MIENKEGDQQRVVEGTDENRDERTEQFNELSELSLEERMAVADKLGIPVENAKDGVSLGTAGHNTNDRQNSSDGAIDDAGQN